MNTNNKTVSFFILGVEEIPESLLIKQEREERYLRRKARNRKNKNN